MPVDMWRDPPEAAAVDGFRIEIDIGIAQHELPGSRSSVEYRPRRRNSLEERTASVVRPCFASKDVRGEDIAAMKERIIGRRRAHLVDVVLHAEHQWSRRVVGF